MLSFRIEGEINSFPDKQKLKEFIITKPDLTEMLESSLSIKEKVITRNKKICGRKNVTCKGKYIVKDQSLKKEV